MHKYGFILRYPEDKTDVTQYGYESWHIRYVGKEAATKFIRTIGLWRNIMAQNKKEEDAEGCVKEPEIDLF